MSLKAGRVGVNPNQVDPVNGYIKSSATEGYTKQEADAKFVTHEAAAALQPKQLAVPLKMLSGSKLTVESALQGLNEEKFERAEQRVLGAKNILAYPYRDTTKTSNVINFVDNKDGTITIKAGTATGGDASFVLHNQGGTFKFADFIGKKCIFSGGLSSSVKITFWVQGTLNITAQGEEVEFTMPDIGSKEWNMTLYVTQNTVISADTVIKPMLRLATDPDDTYVPYAMTNKELTEMMTPVEGTITTEGTLDATVTSLVKIGKTVFFKMKATGVTKEAWASFASVPSEYKPKQTVYVPCMISGVTGLNYCQISTNGYISCSAALTDSTVTIVNTSWITS